MKKSYFTLLVLFLTFLAFIMFCRDALKEGFEDGKVGQCMNLYSKSLLNRKDINLITNPGDRSFESCPPTLCQFSSGKCIPVDEFNNNQTIKDYCKSEQYLENITQKDLCTKLGYVWDNNKCNPTVKLSEKQCPTGDLCSWNSNIQQCDVNIEFNNDLDYDSVKDYCSHLKSLAPTVSKETCDKAGKEYDYNDLLSKCVNINVNTENVYDECYGQKTQDNCLKDGDDNTNCIWFPNLPTVAGAADIKGLRQTELDTLQNEMNKLDTELQSYISSVGPYQQKMDEEQAANLIVKLIERDNKDRYMFETGLTKFQTNYEGSLEKEFK
jgi:hypothetical protein